MIVIAVLATGWVALLVATPWLPTPAAAGMYLFGAHICHQIAERSWHLDGVQLPVCARCFGIYAGAAAGFFVRHRAAAPLSRRTTALAAALAVNVLTMWSPSNAVRGAAGAALGIVLAHVLSTVDYGRWPSARRMTSARPHSRI